MKVGLTVDIAGAMADLDTIDRVVPAQSQQIIARAAQRYEAAARVSTPVGKLTKRSGQRLSTGWQRRVVGPLKVHIVNVRPHAHLAADGWNHVGGKRIAPFVPWIKDAIRARGDMVDDLGDLVQSGFPAPLRVLQVTR